jgi:hypothetical protein
MTDREYLMQNNCRQIGSGKTAYGYVYYWDNPNHQPSVHGAFKGGTAA